MGDGDGQDQLRGNRRSRKKWILLGAAGLVAVAAVAVVAVLRLTATSLVTVEKLESLLLDSAKINAIMGASDMQLGDPESAPEKPAFALSRPDCLGAIEAAQKPTYKDSGYTAVRWTPARNMDGAITHYAAQSAAAFPDADRAAEFVRSSAHQWEGCAGQKVVVMQADKSVIVWQLNDIHGEPPNIAVSETRQDVAWTCQRAMRAVSNVVIDATACGRDITDEASSIADGVAANVPA